MKTNLPITDREVPVGDDDLLIYTTEPSGVIKHCNPGFVRISGFDEPDLLGKGHNIVRHPAMPPGRGIKSVRYAAQPPAISPLCWWISSARASSLIGRPK